MIQYVDMGVDTGLVGDTLSRNRSVTGLVGDTLSRYWSGYRVSW